jgi:putative ABC transport system permease protein
LEAQQGLVAPNFESGIFGGITADQWQQVLTAPGVEVAAPVAYLGYVIQMVEPTLSVDRFTDDAPEQLYRLNTTWLPNGGLSQVPGITPYLLLTSRPHGCDSVAIVGPRPRTPFEVEGPTQSYLTCYGLPSVRGPKAAQQATVAVQAFFPQLVAAIDPTQENKLVGLDRALVSGQPLSEATTSRVIQRFSASPDSKTPVIPVLAASSTFQDQPLRYSVERLQKPAGSTFTEVLNEPLYGVLNNPPPIPEPNRAYRRAQQLTGPVVGSGQVSYQSMYDGLLRRLRHRPDVWPDISNFPSFTAYWAASPVQYRTNAADQLVPQVARNDPDKVWVDPLGAVVSADETHYFPLLPPDTGDVGYRRMSEPREATQIRNDRLIIARFHAQGTFDPAKLPGFDPKSQVPLEAYRPPQVTAADAASRAALQGRPLGPSANVAGYVSQPPALLTTLEAAKGMTDPQYFSGANHTAPISTIRVRVAGVTGPDDASLERIRRVATEIVTRAGLEVDITAGSSPQPQTIALPAGKFGQPPLLLTEGWVKKGVAVAILSAVSAKSALLFGLILVVTTMFLANAALATVRARRRELGVLLALGWSRRHLFGVVLAELALIGLVAGTAGAALSAVLIRLLALDLPLTRVLLVPVVAIALTVVAGLIPAALAARGRPMDVVNPAVTRTRKIRSRGRPATGRGSLNSRSTVVSVPRLAMRNLAQQRGRNATAAFTLALGVAALTAVIAVTAAFNSAIVGSLLGSYITTEVRGVDYLAVALTLLLAALSIADVLLLNVSERAPELVTLQATGWSNSHLTRLTLLEALGIGAAGAIPGAAAGLTLGLLTGAPTLPATLGAAGAAAAGLVLTIAAATLPARQATQGHIATALADE